MTGADNGNGVLLSLNVGSSSLKAAVRDPALRLHVDIAGLDGPDARLTVTVPGGPPRTQGCPGGWPRALDQVAGALERLGAEADRDPLHLPRQLQVVADARAHWPRCAEVLVPDGGFHRQLPDEAVTLPLPAKDRAAGLRRWGFHGLAVQSVADVVADLGAAVAHLGSGCSVTAVQNGRPGPPRWPSARPAGCRR